MLSFLRKLIPKNIAGILGVIQLIIPLVRELLMVITRIIGIFRSELKVEDTVAKIKSISDKVETGFVRFKNLFLGII